MEGAHRGHQPDRAPLAACRRQRGAQVGDRADGDHAGYLRPGQLARRLDERVEQAGRSSGRRSATASRWRATVASSPRATGPVSARSGPRAAQFSTVARTSGTSTLAVRPGGGGEALGRRLERDEEVRGDRGGGVVGGAVLGGDARPGAARAPRRARAPWRARAACSRPRRHPRRANRAPSRVTVISGCSEKPSCSPRTSSASGAGAVADERPGRDRRRGGGDLAVGHAQQHDVGRRRRRRLGRAGRRRPRRPRCRAAAREVPEAVRPRRWRRRGGRRCSPGCRSTLEGYTVAAVARLRTIAVAWRGLASVP